MNTAFYSWLEYIVKAGVAYYNNLQQPRQLARHGEDQSVAQLRDCGMEAHVGSEILDTIFSAVLMAYELRL